MYRDQLVSIIITTKNEEKVIKRLLNSIFAQTYRPVEIILVDNNSKDNTLEIAKKMGIKTYTFGPERSAQRNYGANVSKGKYLLFLDADMELSKEVIKKCVDVCNVDKKIGGAVIPEESKATTYWGRVKAFERSFYNEEGDETTDAARFFSKAVFRKVNGYDQSITGPEDWDLQESVKGAGYKIGRVKSIIFHYERINTPIFMGYKKYYYALRSYRYLSKHKIPTLGPKTVYFLRPVFYKHFNKILAHPNLSFGMFIMLTMELIGGSLGYLVGKLKKL